MRDKTVRTTMASLLLALTSSAWAHDGHGLVGTHLHPSDVFGLLALALGLAWWLNRRGR